MMHRNLVRDLVTFLTQIWKESLIMSKLYIYFFRTGAGVSRVTDDTRLGNYRLHCSYRNGVTKHRPPRLETNEEIIIPETLSDSIAK